MHILLIRFSSLGDVVLQTPMVSWIKSQYPNAKISFLTSKEFASLVDEHPHIDQTYFYERQRGLKDIKSLKAFSQKIENEIKPDLIVDLHGTLRAKLIRFFCSKTLSVVVDKRSLERSLLIKCKIDLLKDLPSNHFRVPEDLAFLFQKVFSHTELSEYLDEQTGINSDRITTTPLSFKKDLPKEIDGKYIVVSPVASFTPKRWPIDRFYSLIELILNDETFKDYKVVIVAGPNDIYCEELNPIKDRFPERFINLQGKTSLAQTNEILAHTSLCISNDTGMTHISESFGNPVITFFGPTSESFGFKPHLKKSKVISANVWCRPCSGTGKKKCFRKEQYCFTLIKPSDVIQEVKEILCS